MNRIVAFAHAIVAVGVLTTSMALAGDEKHWAFQPPLRPVTPQVKEKSWARNPIDLFILAKLEDASILHAPEADRATLLRRLSFDLTGLPPTPEQQSAFLDDRSAGAYERVVDQLLASPHFGERWGQHWLDLARFAETDGYEFDQARPDAWRYRDWVVAALNRDLPYDVFIRMQLAGDEARPDDAEAFVATGFNRCYPDMVDLNDQGLRRQNALNDITETTGLVFLGLTIGCARCHDHKFDPIRQTDFYSLQAFFAGARFRDDYPLAPAHERSVYEASRRTWEQNLAAARASLIQIESRWRDGLAPGPPPGANDEVAAAFAKPAAERSPREVQLVFDTQAHDRRVPRVIWGLVLDPLNRSLRLGLLGRIDRLVRTTPTPLPKARGIDETGPKSPQTYLLRRGEYAAKGQEVAPGFLPVLSSGPTASRPNPEPTSRSSGRRSALAVWLVRPDHPLTARVLVNRLWQHHYGRGIVATPSDFGTAGEEPSHLELLDWLACELVAQGWSVKAIHRLIVTSATYRQSSRGDRAGAEGDPENSLLWRQNRRRLDGEAIRDALLAVSGRLNQAMAGPSIFPELPAELSKLSSKGAVWPVSPRREDRERRSVYVFVRRNLRYPLFEVFDRPDTNASCPSRPVTTIAPQALSLLNGRLAHESADALAARIIALTGVDKAQQVMCAGRLVFGRSPDATEREMLTRFLSGDGTLTQLCLAILNTNAFLYVD
jgi:hypothetical protein